MGTVYTTVNGGFKIEIGNGATPEVFTRIGGVLKIAAPQPKRDTIDSTDLADTGKTFVAGLVDGGEVALDLNVNPADAGQIALKAAFAAATAVNFRVSLTDVGPTKCDFAALVTAAPSASGGVSSKLETSATLKVSGTPVWS